MRCFLFLIFLGLSTICFAQPDNPGTLTTNKDIYTGEFTYQIGPGDSIQINVWQHPDLNMQIRVRPDCKIAFPLIDEINVFNMTTEALKKELTVKLSRIIQDPEVTVNAVGFQSKKFFVLGEVNQPGVYPFEGRERVLDAISKAMGYKEESAALPCLPTVSSMLRRSHSSGVPRTIPEPGPSLTRRMMVGKVGRKIKR